MHKIESFYQDAASLTELVGWKVVKRHYSYGGLQAMALEKDNNIVVAYRGSEKVNSWEFVCDWIVADGLGWATGVNVQVPAAKSFVKKVCGSIS